ncbi:hypothetical protein AB0F49_24715 [Micromonospora ureilytica]|uniref:hypothetical protein n=1 Tax=Micromonospora ureilytica TaxID=709868 RepID=UPI00340D0B81
MAVEVGVLALLVTVGVVTWRLTRRRRTHVDLAARRMATRADLAHLSPQLASAVVGGAPRGTTASDSAASPHRLHDGHRRQHSTVRAGRATYGVTKECRCLTR